LPFFVALRAKPNNLAGRTFELRGTIWGVAVCLMAGTAMKKLLLTARRKLKFRREG
jgi:hypothetical protein